MDWAELTVILRALVQSGSAVGMTVTIFNPRLDPDGSIARSLVESLASGLH